MSLDTLANVKSRLGVTGSSDDALLGQLMDSADAWVATYTGRDFAGGSFTEYFPGNAELLCLANFPVTSVTSVKVDPAGGFGSETVIAATSYAVHSERGVIQSKVGPFVGPARSGGLASADHADWTRSPRAVEVVYTTASSAVPNDVKEAYSRLVGHWYRQVKNDLAAAFQNLDEQKFGDVTVRFRLEARPADVEQLLAPYRTPTI